MSSFGGVKTGIDKSDLGCGSSPEELIKLKTLIGHSFWDQNGSEKLVDFRDSTTQPGLDDALRKNNQRFIRKL